MRSSKEKYYLSIAEAVSRQGTCLRRNFGAVIVRDDQIISTGYTGSPRKAPNCNEINHCIRKEKQIPHGQMYELCRSVHAEMNAMLHASRGQMIGATMYLSGYEHESRVIVEDSGPCKLCKKLIINSGIEAVVVRKGPNDIQRLLPSDWIANEDEIFANESDY